MKVKILKTIGIYSEGDEVEMSYARGSQYLAGELAEEVFPAPPAKKAKIKAKAKKVVAEAPVEESTAIGAGAAPEEKAEAAEEAVEDAADQVEEAVAEVEEKAEVEEEPKPKE